MVVSLDAMAGSLTQDPGKRSLLNIKHIDSVWCVENKSIRAELRRQVDGRCARRPFQFDSVTGISSSEGSAGRPLMLTLKKRSQTSSGM